MRKRKITLPVYIIPQENAIRKYYFVQYCIFFEDWISHSYKHNDAMAYCANNLVIFQNRVVLPLQHIIQRHNNIVNIQISTFYKSFLVKKKRDLMLKKDDELETVSLGSNTSIFLFLTEEADQNVGGFCAQKQPRIIGLSICFFEVMPLLFRL